MAETVFIADKARRGLISETIWSEIGWRRRRQGPLEEVHTTAGDSTDTEEGMASNDMFAVSPQLESGHNAMQPEHTSTAEDSNGTRAKTEKQEMGDTQESKTLWPTLASMLQYLAVDEKKDGLSTEGPNAVPNTTETAFIPMLPIHNDPVQFLKNQENVLLHDRLPKLIELHRRCLQSGDKHLATARKEIVMSIQELNKNYEALNEIYLSEKYSKLDKYGMFVDWIKNKSSVNSKIAAITNNSNEGQTYKSLLHKSDQITDKINSLEKELQNLKNQKKLICHQLLETKSLLEIKLNIYNDELDTVTQKEKTEIDLMFKEAQIRSNKYSDVEVSENLKSQINSLDILIDTSSSMQSKFEQSQAYLWDIFDTLDKMENSVKTFIEESKTEQLEPLLLSNRTYLMERLSQCKSLHLTDAEVIITNELKAIEKALSILNIDIPESSIGKENDHAAEVSSLNISGDSTEYYPIVSSLDNISMVSSNKQSLQISNKQKSLSISPPATFVNVTPTMATTATTTANAAKIGLGAVSNKTSKYDNLVKGIKISKGGKAE